MLTITQRLVTKLVDLNGTDSLGTPYQQYKCQIIRMSSLIRVTPSAKEVKQGRDYTWLENQEKKQGRLRLT